MDIKTRKPVFTQIIPDRHEFFEVCDAILEVIPNASKQTRDIIWEIKWNAYDSPTYRAKLFPQLEEFFSELYEESQQ